MERNNCSKLPSYWYWLTAIWHDFASQTVEFQVLLKQQQHTGPSSNKCTCFHSSSYCCFFESAGDTPPFCSLYPQRNIEPFKMKLWLIPAIILSIGVQAGTWFQFITLCFLCAYPFCLHFSIFAPTRHSQSVIFVMPCASCVLSFETFRFKLRENFGEIWKMKRTSVGLNCFCEGRFYIFFFSFIMFLLSLQPWVW